MREARALARAGHGRAERGVRRAGRCGAGEIGPRVCAAREGESGPAGEVIWAAAIRGPSAGKRRGVSGLG